MKALVGTFNTKKALTLEWEGAFSRTQSTVKFREVPLTALQFPVQCPVLLYVTCQMFTNESYNKSLQTWPQQSSDSFGNKKLVLVVEEKLLQPKQIKNCLNILRNLLASNFEPKILFVIYLHKISRSADSPIWAQCALWTKMNSFYLFTDGILFLPNISRLHISRLPYLSIHKYLTTMVTMAGTEPRHRTLAVTGMSWSSQQT